MMKQQPYWHKCHGKSIVDDDKYNQHDTSQNGRKITIGIRVGQYRIVGNFDGGNIDRLASFRS